MPGTCWSTSGHERLVKAPCVSHGTKAAQGVGQHDGAGLEVAPGPGGDLLAAKRSDTAQAHSHRSALTIEFDRSDERRLARCASSAFAAAARPAPIRIIELHPAAQRARVVALRVRTRIVQKCTVRNGPLTLADRSSCRSSNRSSPHEVLGAVSGLHHPLVAVRGPSRREQPDDVERRQTDSNRPHGTGTRCCNGQTNVFVKHRSDIDHQRQDHRSLQRVPTTFV